jgi:tetratricopeptide (TPR) repeat protein
LEYSPKNAVVNRSRAGLCFQRGDRLHGIELLREALSANPMDSEANRELSLAYSTSPEADLRSPDMALFHAFKAFENARVPDAGIFEALAAAFAENREFEAAKDFEEKACALATAAGHDEVSFQRRIELFERGNPLRMEFGSTKLGY